ncbi:WPP domain-interacting protein 1-like isoform X1 [Macadamia integrifolia]|uniref:WPP domain-interacting protein 1-like isoform X1 n=1 Tax=Macadamia integrifolia TaxID=60698 RepID=UPI001C52F9C7|nr:WPP domain-interacting protein 1-like isoform X1 [Macadamia integrifolia]XP_042478399.1 WPP domain-interacting protein 1-like isoform X2 [Macadamia integrifolia]XP_042478400.1 WPP domain-interacting protein 1-like isoform X1 [Macadamia integrifolia]
MDLLEGECSELKSAKDKEEAPEKTTVPCFDGIEAENNGSCGNEVVGIGHGERVEIKTSAEERNQPNGKAIGIGLEMQPVEPQQPSNSSATIDSSPPLPPSGVTAPTPTTPTTTSKGYGLKKWRRIRRDFPKDGSSSPDFNRILKRGLSIAAEPTRPRDPSAEIKPRSEGSIASVNSSVKSPPSFSSVPAVKGSTLDSRLAVGSTVPVCTDSENSEDRSSKSSTAASAPTLSYDVPLFVGASSSSRDKCKIKNMSGKISAGAAQKAQQGKSRIETSKKSRAERFKIEKENSYSSLESDSRSSNVLFVQMDSFSGIGNGRQSEKSCNYDGENSDGAHVSEMRSNDEVGMDYGKENGVVIEDVSQDDVAADMPSEVREEETDNHQSTTDRDPLIDLILPLQSVQESLEREIEMYGEIGQETVFPADESIASHCFMESHFEDETNRSEPLKEELGSSLKSLQGFGQMEIELEDLIKQKIEAEVDYLVITRSTQNFKVASVNHISLLEEQSSLVEEQTQMLERLRDTESCAVLLKRQAEELEESCGELLETEGVLEMQNRVCKFTFCFLIQLILLFVAFGIFLLQLLPHSVGFVPT